MSTTSVPRTTATITNTDHYVTPTSTTTSDSNSVTLSAATYYGAVALAIFFLFFLTFLSRLCYIKRARVRQQAERADLERRGEAAGLPTYHETTAPSQLSYWGTRVSRPLATHDPSQPQTRLGRLVRSRPAQSGTGEPEPPAYIEPPKYEEASLPVSDEGDEPRASTSQQVEMRRVDS